MNKSGSASVVRNSASFEYSKFNSVSSNNTLGPNLDGESQCASVFTTTIGEREKHGCDNCSKHFKCVCCVHACMCACVRVCVACMNACVCVCVHCAYAQTLKKDLVNLISHDIVSLLPGLPIVITCFKGIGLLQERIIKNGQLE